MTIVKKDIWLKERKKERKKELMRNVKIIAG